MSKIFCIGQNKTGTTSLKHALTILGYNFCPEDVMYKSGSKYFEDYKDKKYDNILSFVAQYEAFEDRPWNHTNFYEVLDNTFNDSKFILTTKDVDSWWDSYLRWDNKIGLRFMWHYKINSQACYGIDSFLDDPNTSKKIYTERNNQIRSYFAGNPNFMELDLDGDNKFQKLSIFLNKDIPSVSYPHFNKT